MTFRTVQTTSSGFIFDGTNSDIAQQLYNRHKAGNFVNPVILTSIPSVVAGRLDPLKIDFNDLPGLVQRALLWDSGFALSPDNDAVQIWTMDDYTMADIAVPKDDVSSAGCTFKNCSQPNDEKAHYTLICSGKQMLSVARCVADMFTDTGKDDYMGAMWSRGGAPDMVPHIRLRNHTWTDPVSKISFTVAAVHTTTDKKDVAWNTCPANGGYGSLAIPCHRREEYTDRQMAAMRIPTGSIWVTTWLEEEFREDTSSSKLLLILVIVGAVVVLAVAGIVFYCCRRRSKKKANHTPSGVCDLGVASPIYCGAATPDSDLTLRGTTSTRPTTHSSFFSYSDSLESFGSNNTLKILLSSHHLQGKRIPYENITLQTSLAKGVSGEVWLGMYNDQQVAVKRMLQSNLKAEHVQSFAEEIELSASLVHPGIVQFIGVAWNSLNNLTMVIEFFPKGNLQTYLHKNIDLLSWARDKIHMAVAIAQALQYLHTRSPVIIHRDLKSNNILLTEKLEPKLIDFGESRGIVDSTMTAGVGTPYWTAPEILEGKRYTEQADIYSFGVVLSELDTGRIPFNDAVTDSGGKAKPFHILQDVMAAFDPLTRPTASQLVEELLGNSSELVYVL